jgi:hypothetical protein
MQRNMLAFDSENCIFFGVGKTYALNQNGMPTVVTTVTQTFDVSHPMLPPQLLKLLNPPTNLVHSSPTISAPEQPTGRKPNGRKRTQLRASTPPTSPLPIDDDDEDFTTPPRTQTSATPRDAKRNDPNLQENGRPMCVPGGICILAGRKFYRLEMFFGDSGDGSRMRQIKPLSIVVRGSKLLSHRFHNPDIIHASDLESFTCLVEERNPEDNSFSLNVSCSRRFNQQSGKGKSVDLNLNFEDTQIITLRLHIACYRHSKSNYVLQL